MPAVTACPDLARYQEMASGHLTPDAEEALLHHLEGCDACAGRVESLPEHDSLIEWVRQVRTQPEDPSAEKIARLVERLSKLGPGATVPASKERTQGPDKSAPPAEVEPPTLPLPQGNDRELYDFLAPPRTPDELGRLGHYRILKVLGTGGMGVVFLADEPSLKRRVALKAMLPALAASASARRRFLREAQAAAAIQHDHIVAIHFVGEDRGVPFLAMPFLPGESLDDRLQREGRLPDAEVLRIGREMAEGLAAAHERGLIHRDVKPANVWLESRPGEPGASATGGRVKILDFGLARSAGGEANLTKSGAIVGTPAYMAPEQARGEAVDGRCDLFGLGCVLYRMCTGQVPFRGTDTISTLMAVATEVPPAPRALQPGVAPALEALILRLLAKEPGDRPADACAVVEVLAALERDPAAMPPVRKPPRSFRRPLAGAAVLVVALLVAAVVLTLTLRTRDGTLEVTVSEPGVKVLIDGQVKVVLESKKTGRLELVPGTHRLTIRRGEEELYAEQFTLKSGDKVLIDARWTPKEDEAWLQEVARLPPEKQVEAVAARLRERNPGFDGKVTAKIEGGAVTSLALLTDNVTDISPVRALKGLQTFNGSGSALGKGKLADLSPLKGLPLTGMDCHSTPLSDLTPLKGMKLTFLGCSRTPVSDLAPLKDMTLTTLYCDTTAVSDLSPLAGMPLTHLTCFTTPVSDLAPLAGMKLTYLDCAGTKVSSLSPLKDMPLTVLWCQDTAVTDLTPLAGMPLKELHCDFKPERDTEILRSIKTLATINEEPAAEFWKKVDAQRTDKKP